MLSLLYVQSQSIQSARLSIQSSDLGPPTSSPARDWFPPPLVVKGGRHTPLQVYYNHSTCAIYYTHLKNIDLYCIFVRCFVFYEHLALWHMRQFFSQVFLYR